MKALFVFLLSAVHSFPIFPIVHVMFSVPLFKSLLLDGNTSEWIARNLKYKEQSVLDTLITKYENTPDSQIVVDALYSQSRILRAYEICEYVRSLDSKFVYYPQVQTTQVVDKVSSEKTFEEVLAGILEIFKEVTPLNNIQRAFDNTDIMIVPSSEYNESSEYMETGIIVDNVLYVHILDDKCIKITSDINVDEGECPNNSQYHVVVKYSALDSLNFSHEYTNYKKKSIEILQLVQVLML